MVFTQCSRKSPFINAMASAVAIASFASDVLPAQASVSETKAEIRELRDQLRRLERRLETQEHKNGSEAKGSRRGKGTDKEEATAYVGKFVYKGIEITPGGYFAGNTVFRNHWMGSDTATNWGNTPYLNNPAAHTEEFRFTARQSQLSLRVDGNVDPSTHLRGYVEVDFLGAAQTANNNQTNSYNPRIRHLYSTVDLNDLGLHFVTGQTWSLNTLNSKGIRPDAMATPPVMDGNLMVAFVYKRNPQFRIVKEIGKEFHVAFSVEGSSTVVAAPGPAGLPGATTNLPTPFGFTGAPIVSSTPLGGGLFNSTNPYTFNRMPDYQGKIAWDTDIGGHEVHLEAFGLLHDITERAYWGNHSVWGGGVGGGAVVSVIPKILEIQASVMNGTGVSQYAPALLPEAAYSLSGGLLPIHERVINIGGILHVTPTTELFAFAGGEFTSSRYQTGVVGTTVVLAGYGNPGYNNIACNVEAASAYIGGLSSTNPGAVTACSGQVKAVRQLFGGVWHTFYQGDYGKLRAGVQYAYTVKDAFSGVGPTPKATENTIYTSIRYYPF